MKKFFKFNVLFIMSIISIFTCSGCFNNTMINIKGIEIYVSNVNSNREYEITFLSIDIVSDNEQIKIYQKENPTYIITKPNKPFSETYFAPNVNSIINAKSDKFILLVNLTVKYLNKEYHTSCNETILIVKKNNEITLKNERYKDTIISEIAELSFNIDSNITEYLTLDFNYSQIKN